MSAGTVLVAAPRGVTWLARTDGGREYASAYLRGRLVRRDLAGWWVAGIDGRRTRLTRDDLAALRGTAPDGGLIWWEHVELADVRCPVCHRELDVETSL